MNGTLPIDRWIISGKLTTLAPLAIRTGLTETVKRPDDSDGTLEKALIALDYRGRPYLPATAIKGMVRAIAVARLLDDTKKDAVRRLFGDLPRSETKTNPTDPATQQAQGGAAEFRDAFTAVSDTVLDRGQTRIDRKRGTAEDKLLRQGQFAAEGTSFAVEIILDRVAEKDVELLCTLLAALDGAGPHSQMGGAGGAPVKATGLSVKHWGQAEIVAWLAADATSSWQDFGTIVDAIDWFNAPADPATIATIVLTLPITGHFLVSRANPRKKKGDELPNLIPASQTADVANCAWLPKSALKGALRAQAERICRTLGVTGKDPDWLDTPVEALFGSTRRAGLLKVGDLTGAKAEPVTLDMVAIDRLSGSAAGGAKFAVLAWEAPTLTGMLQLVRKKQVNHALSGKPGTDQPPETDSAAIGLFALVLRDLGEGDIALGYGARKGFGHVRPDGWVWRAALDELGSREDVNACVAAFRSWAKPQQIEGAAA